MEHNRVPQNEQHRLECEFEQIIGHSPALKSVLAEVKRVAPTDSTVLVLGETGTGKELIAHATHNLSPRRGRPFIKLNCAAIPFDLLESELFGHEKGAFTGAVTQKIGRFEMADTGTLFLDEIGDIPLALQPKLLRVLQEKEFERLGSGRAHQIDGPLIAATPRCSPRVVQPKLPRVLQEKEFERLGSGRTHQIDVRLIAATHRDLTEMVSRNEFRSDLYYRLNVFPVLVPPVRERREDIQPLVSHFVEVFAQRMGKHIEQIPQATMTALIAYSWRGNVRELQNLIERAVIRSDNGVLPNPLPRSKKEDAEATTLSNGTFLESQRALILQALEATGWGLGGPLGAAARLGLKRTTLVSKMKKLGIYQPRRQRVMDEFNERSELAI